MTARKITARRDFTSRPRRLVGKASPVLHARAREVDIEDPHTYEVAAALALTADAHMREAVAVAAPQIGFGLRLVVFTIDTGCDDPRRVFANPVVEGLPGPTATEVEGCLSLPGRWYEVERPVRCQITAWLLGEDEHGQNRAEERTWQTGGLAARAWFHEVDHLDGRLISDHGTPARQRSVRHLI